MLTVETAKVNIKGIITLKTVHQNNKRKRIKGIITVKTIHKQQKEKNKLFCEADRQKHSHVKLAHY